MPIEIKELHIKINVDDKTESTDPKEVKKNVEEKLIAACVDQVMEILAKNQER